MPKESKLANEIPIFPAWLSAAAKLGTINGGEFSLKAGNKLHDEMGMTKGADGFREQPMATLVTEQWWFAKSKSKRITPIKKMV